MYNYTAYISAMLDSHGIPQLSEKTFRTLMNVVALEHSIKILRKLRKAQQNPDLKHAYNLEEYNLQKQLDVITWQYPPEAFFKRILMEA